jgi:hypothetical protein
MKVKDNSGAVIVGLHRTQNGGLLVDKKTEYQRYLKERESLNQIKTLQEEVDELKKLVHGLLALNNPKE